MLICTKCYKACGEEDFYSRKDGGLFRQCRSCITKAASEWSRAHPGAVRERARRWRIENSDYLKKKYRLEHPSRPRPPKKERLRHYFRGQFCGPMEWVEPWALIGFILWADQRRRQRANLYKKEWLDRNPEIKKRRNKHKLVKKDERRKEAIRLLFLGQNGACNFCGVDLRLGQHVDHIRPLSKGGSNKVVNLQLLCPPCNIAKADKYPYEPQSKAGQQAPGKPLEVEKPATLQYLLEGV